MNEKQVIREAMAIRGWSQAKLAEEAGFKSQSNITGILNNTSKGIRVDNLVRLLNAMGCELVVRDKMGTKKEWLITMLPDDDSSSSHSKTVEELLSEGKISFEEAVSKGWKPSREMLARMLGGDTK